MKTFKLLLLFSAVIVVSYFFWAYYTNRSLQEKHDRATLVYDGCLKSQNILIRGYCYE